MSEAITTTTVEILNRAFRVCSGGYKIADDESIETINGKINAPPMSLWQDIGPHSP